MSVMFKVLLGAGAMSDELGKMAKRKSEILNHWYTRLHMFA